MVRFWMPAGPRRRFLRSQQGLNAHLLPLDSPPTPLALHCAFLTLGLTTRPRKVDGRKKPTFSRGPQNGPGSGEEWEPGAHLNAALAVPRR